MNRLYVYICVCITIIIKEEVAKKLRRVEKESIEELKKERAGGTCVNKILMIESLKK